MLTPRPKLLGTLLTFLFFGTFSLQAQQPGCNDLWYDSGGPTGNYSPNEDSTITFCPEIEGHNVSLYFTHVDIEASAFGSGTQSCWDYLQIYDGPDVNSPLIGIFCGEESGNGNMPNNPDSELRPGDIISSTNGCITARFKSDGSVQRTGWEASVVCGAAFNCTSPQVSVETTRQCEDLTFTAVLTVDSAGIPETSPLLSITASIGGIQVDGGTISNIAGQSIELGPFAMDQTVTITTNILGMNCPTILGATESSIGCPINLTCGGELYSQTYCYKDNDDVVFYYHSPDDEPITLFFQEGTLESCCDDILIYDGVDNTAPLLYSGNNGGDLSGLSVQSTGGDIFMAIDSDLSVSCQAGSTSASPWTWVAGCGEFDLPGCTDPLALNYLPVATVDDGSCIYPIPGQVCISPLEVSSLPYYTSGNTADYFDDYASADMPPLADGAIGSPSSLYLGGDDVVYAFTPEEDQTIDITVSNHGSWTGVFVFTGCRPFESTVGGHTNSSATVDLVVEHLPVQAGVTYYIVISTFPSPQSTSYSLSITRFQDCEGTPDAGTP